MRNLAAALVVMVAGFSTAYAAPAPFSNKSYGDGGAYKHPDAAVGQFFETKPPRPAELKPERSPVPSKISAEIQPIAEIPSRPRPRPFVPVVEKTDAPSRSVTSRPEEAERNVSVFPKTGDAAANDPDSDSESARLDYETRLLGAAPGPRRAGLSNSNPRTPADSAQSGSTSEGMMFVSLELDAREAGALRDAVAGLGEAAAFRPDARFQPLPGEGGSVRISGWLPAARLANVIARPGVRRIEIERASRPAGDSRLTGGYLLKLRVTDASRPEESVAASARELAAATGFKLDRVFGFETVLGGGATALVSGTIPVSQLSRALGLPGVIKITARTPASAADENVLPIRARTETVKKEGFIKFVMARGLWLVLLTALLALPVIGEAIKSGLDVFVPYR